MYELLFAVAVVCTILLILVMGIMLCKPGSYIYDVLVTKSQHECSHIDGRCYKIAGVYENDTAKAADILANLNKDCVNFIRYMRDTYLWNPAYVDSKDPAIVLRKIITEHMTNRYDPSQIIENAPWSKNETSYTKNKGEYMALCIREKHSQSHQLEEYSKSQFVILHELTHIATNIPEHEKPFWYIFKVILQEAEQAGIYKPIPYEKMPMRVCGLPVDYNPYYDKSLDESYLYPLLSQI
jgi:hypothetical protein